MVLLTVAVVVVVVRGGIGNSRIINSYGCCCGSCISISSNISISISSTCSYSSSK